ncbi:MAG: hypothetical protein HYY35_11250 [Deltaproteobacteria bacterium]|nr:hypothetical protein [Deltaproteobacteria bacterium]
MIIIHCIACKSPMPLHEEVYGQFRGRLGCCVCGSSLDLETETAPGERPRVVRLAAAEVVEVHTS